MTKGENLQKIPLNKLEPHPNNIFRELSDTELEELAESIRVNGLIHPLVVRPLNGRYQIISGHQRKRALELLGWDEAPCIVKELSDDEAEVMLIDANIQTRKLSVMETARAVRRRKEILLSSDEKKKGQRYCEVLAEEFGFSKSKVIYLDKINDLIPELQELVDSGGLSIRSAVQIADLDKKTQELLYQILGNEISSIKSKEIQKMKEESERGYLVLKILEKRVKELEEQLNDIKSTHAEKEELLKEIEKLRQKKRELSYDLAELENLSKMADKKTCSVASLYEELENIVKNVKHVQPRVEHLLGEIELDDYSKKYCKRLVHSLFEFCSLVEQLIS